MCTPERTKSSSHPPKKVYARSSRINLVFESTPIVGILSVQMVDHLCFCVLTWFKKVFLHPPQKTLETDLASFCNCARGQSVVIQFSIYSGA